MQYKCYICRKYKPATHSHFVNYGMYALFPLTGTSHITEIRALWEYMPDKLRAQLLEGARVFFVRAEADAPVSDTVEIGG